MKRRSLSVKGERAGDIWKARQGGGKISKSVTNIQTLHHFIYIIIIIITMKTAMHCFTNMQRKNSQFSKTLFERDGWGWGWQTLTWEFVL